MRIGRQTDWEGLVRMEDTLSKIAATGVDIAIITLICVSLFSGRPAFVTSGGLADSPPAAVLTH
jgi:hypothetical protein